MAQLTRHDLKISLLTVAMIFGGFAAQAGNESRSKAYPLQNGQFEVIADFSESSLYWCGAGTYALKTLSRPISDRVYVWASPSASAVQPVRKSVRFGFQPPPGVGAVSSISTDVAIVGNSLSVSQARETCNERTATSS